MVLKSFGCSFIWGSDMLNSNWHASLEAWPALLARHHGMTYRCYAHPGCGNLYITEKILELAKPNDFIVVQWTFIDRFDYKDASSNEWKTLRPISDTGVAKTYYQHLHSQYQDKLTSLINIKVCIDHLNQLGCQFIMTYIDYLLFEDTWHHSPAIAQLQNYIKPYLKTFDGDNMLDYSRRQGHEISNNNHPLASAHQELFLYARDNFIKEQE